MLLKILIAIIFLVNMINIRVTVSLIISYNCAVFQCNMFQNPTEVHLTLTAVKFKHVSMSLICHCIEQLSIINKTVVFHPVLYLCIISHKIIIILYSK